MPRVEICFAVTFCFAVALVGHRTEEISPLLKFNFFVYYHSRLSALLSDASAEDEKKLEKMKKWKEWRDKLNSKYKKTRGKFNKVKGQGIPKQPKKVQEQLQITRVRVSYIALLIVLCTAYIKVLLRGPTYFVRVYARNNFYECE